jgi:hypothetical protein
MTSAPESVKSFIEDHAFSRSYDLALRPSTPPPSPVSKLDWRHTGRLRKRDNTLLPGEGEGAGKEMNHSAARKPGLL